MKSNLKKISYRSDIDGLRALSIILVLLYHLEVNFFSGGYIGVDIFFVISGFLIFRIIFNEINETKAFNFKNFYIRRIRRLLPALIFTLLIVFVAGFLIFPPHLFQELSMTYLTSLLSISNFYFWSQAGYFDISSNLKPLLHTWSLSVEEQFYLIAPIGTYLIYNFLNKKNFFYFFIFLFLLSLTISIFYHEIRNTGVGSSDFYLMPFRAYEFVIGILAVFLLKFWPKYKVFNEIFFILGLILIFYSAIFFDEYTHLPSYNALIPCMGAFFIIMSGENKIKFSSILKNKIAIRIGLISYSLYLVHWPLIVFYKYLFVERLTIIDQLIIIFISLIISHFMYENIEKTFRYSKDYLSEFKINKGSLLFFSVFLIPIFLAAHSWYSKGWYWRLSNDNKKLLISSLNQDFKEIKECRYKRYDSKLSSLEFEEKFIFCSKKYGAAILILGDSHAADFYNALAINIKNDHFVDMSKGGMNLISDMQNQTNHYKDIKKFIIQNKSLIKNVLYTQRGTSFFGKDNNFYKISKIDYVISFLNSLRDQGLNVLWIGHLLEPGFDISKFNFLLGDLKKDINFYIDEKLIKLDQFLLSYTNKSKIKYLSKINMINIDYNKDFIVDGHLTYSNEDHWSVKGEEYFGKRILNNEQIKKIFLID